MPNKLTVIYRGETFVAIGIDHYVKSFEESMRTKYQLLSFERRLYLTVDTLSLCHSLRGMRKYDFSGYCF
jgi:hypothetical protein